jgi:hypothetical protein
MVLIIGGSFHLQFALARGLVHQSSVSVKRLCLISVADVSPAVIDRAVSQAPA